MGFCLLLQTHLLPLILHSFPCTSQTEPLEVPKCAIIIPSACLCICSSLWLEGHIAKPPSSLSSSPISLEKPVFTIPAWWTYEYAHCTLYSTAHTQRYLLLFTSVSLLDCEWLVVRIHILPDLCIPHAWYIVGAQQLLIRWCSHMWLLFTWSKNLWCYYFVSNHEEAETDKLILKLI